MVNSKRHPPHNDDLGAGEYARLGQISINNNGNGWGE